MSAAQQPSAPPPTPPAAGGGQPPTGPPAPPAAPPTTTPTTVSPDDKFYCKYRLDRAIPQAFTIGDRDVGIVLARGRKSPPYLSDTYTVDDLLPADVDTGTLYVIRTGTMSVTLQVITVHSLDHWAIDLELGGVVEIRSPAALIDERDPEGKLEIVVASAARGVFGRYTVGQLGGMDMNSVALDTLQQAIRDTCDRDTQAGRGIAGLAIQRVDFLAPWDIPAEAREEDKPEPQPAPPPPPDDAQLLDLLDRNPTLLREVVAACLSEATSAGLLAADAARFDAIQNAQTVLLRDQWLHLRQMIHGALPPFKGGAGSGTP